MARLSARNLTLSAAVMFITFGLLGCRSGTAVQPDAPTPTQPGMVQRPQAVSLYTAGIMAMDTGDVSQAEQQMLQAVKRNDQLIMPRIRLGDLYRSRDQYDQALTQYLRAAELDPYTARNHYNVGLSHQMLSQLEQANTAYDRVLELEPDDFATHLNQGLVLRDLGEVPQAIEKLERAVELESKNPVAHLDLGLALNDAGRTSEAEQSFRRALELQPDPPLVTVTLANLGANLQSQGKFADAAEAFRLVVSSNPSPANLIRFGDALVGAGEIDEGIVQFDRVLSAQSDFVPALNAKAAALIARYNNQLGLNDEPRLQAIELWTRSLSFNPGQPDVRAMMDKWKQPPMFE